MKSDYRYYNEDGKVAVLYSANYESEWYNEDFPETIFDPVIVQMVLDYRKENPSPWTTKYEIQQIFNKKVQAYLVEKYGLNEWGDPLVSARSASRLAIEWVSPGVLVSLEPTCDGKEEVRVLYPWGYHQA